MTTGYIVLPVGGGVNADGSGSGNASARLEKVVNSGTQTTNAPKASYTTLLFDPSTDQHWFWNFILPGNYSSGGTLRIKFGSKGTSGNVIWKAALAQSVDGTTDLDTGNTIFDTVVLSAATAVPGTVGKSTAVTLGLTGSYAANSYVILMLGRDADNGSDTSTADAVLLGLTFEYTTT